MSIDNNNATILDEWFTLKFENSNASSDDIPLPVLASGLSAVELVVHLLLGSHECGPGETLDTNSRLRKQFENRFRLTCGQSKMGSYAVPVRLDMDTRVRTEDLFAEEGSIEDAISTFKGYVDNVLVAASDAESQKFVKLLENEDRVKRVAKALEIMIPKNGYELRLLSASYPQNPIFDSNRDRKALRNLVRQVESPKRSAKTTTKELSIVARIEVLDVANRSYRASTPEGLSIKGNIDEDLSDAMVIISPDIVELSGDFEVDEYDHVHSAATIHESKRIDTSSIEVEHVYVNNERLRANPPLRYDVQFDNVGFFYTLEGDFDLRLYAYSREDLEDLLHETLQECWLDFALEEDNNKLDAGAHELKKALLSRLEQI